MTINWPIYIISNQPACHVTVFMPDWEQVSELIINPERNHFKELINYLGWAVAK